MTHRRFTYSFDVQILSDGPQADLGLWAITNLGIKYLMTTDTSTKTRKRLNVGQMGPFLFCFSGPPPVPPGIDI